MELGPVCENDWSPRVRVNTHAYTHTHTDTYIHTYIFVVPYVYLLYYVCIAVLTLDTGLLARSQYPEGPATGHLDTGFSWFPCGYKQMLRWFPSFQVATTCPYVALPT